MTVFDSILALIRPSKDDAPPTSAAISEAIGSAQAELRALAAAAEALRQRRVDLVLTGDDAALDELEAEVAANNRHVERAEALLEALEVRLVDARDRESEADLDAKVAEAETLRAEYEKLLTDCGALFRKAAPKLERMKSIVEELRQVGVYLDAQGRGSHALTGHPDRTLRPLAEAPFEEVAVVPPLTAADPSFPAKHRTWFRQDPADVERMLTESAVGSDEPAGAYDLEGNPLQDESGHVAWTRPRRRTG